MQDVEYELIVKAVNGDKEAFRLIYNISADFVYCVVLRIIGYNEDAQDVTQDVFLKVYNNLNKFKHKSSFKTWIYRIAVQLTL